MDVADDPKRIKRVFGNDRGNSKQNEKEEVLKPVSRPGVTPSRGDMPDPIPQPKQYHTTLKQQQYNETNESPSAKQNADSDKMMIDKKQLEKIMENLQKENEEKQLMIEKELEQRAEKARRKE